MFQVRIQRPVETIPSPAQDPQSDAESEPAAPAEQDELLDSVAAAEQSDWL